PCGCDAPSTSCWLKTARFNSVPKGLPAGAWTPGVNRVRVPFRAAAADVSSATSALAPLARMLPFAATFPSEYGVVISSRGASGLPTVVNTLLAANTLLAPVCTEAQAWPDTAANASQAASASSISFVLIVPSSQEPK